MTKQRGSGSGKDSRNPAAQQGTADGMNETPRAKAVPADDAIGAGLKRIFDDVVKEPIPPEFLDLLNRIDQTND